MEWKEAMRLSGSGVIQHEAGAKINGPSKSVPSYDVLPDGMTLILGIPDEKGVDRVLEEFAIPRQGWM